MHISSVLSLEFQHFEFLELFPNLKNDFIQSPVKKF